MNPKARFDDRTVLVTGGTSGIGRACAIRFSLEGAAVVVAGRDRERGETVVEEIHNNGGTSIFLPLDVSDETSIKKASKSIKEKYGTLNVLVNAAGIYPRFDTLDVLNQKDWDNVFSTNVTGLVMTTKHFIPLLEATGGTIVNIASVAGLQDYSSGQGYAYAASKAAVIKFTKMTAKIYAGRIRINCVCPGIIDTPLYYALDREKMSQKIPSKRVGLPEDVANLVAFLASDEANYICGESVVVDGGLTL